MADNSVTELVVEGQMAIYCYLEASWSCTSKGHSCLALA